MIRPAEELIRYLRVTSNSVCARVLMAGSDLVITTTRFLEAMQRSFPPGYFLCHFVWCLNVSADRTDLS